MDPVQSLWRFQNPVWNGLISNFTFGYLGVAYYSFMQYHLIRRVKKAAPGLKITFQVFSFPV